MGQTRLAAPEREVELSVRFKIAARASAVVPLAVDKVAALPLQVFTVLKPAIASSTILVIFSLITVPQVPLNSPCVGSANFRRVLYDVDIYKTSRISKPQ